tara:strand:+ start:369 stop:578 length:210 start_codon:yes stop_codon:yes gene_type:complete
MSCEFNDLLVLEMVMEWFSVYPAVAGDLTPEEVLKMEEIGSMIEEIGRPPMNEQIDAVYEAVKEIRDRH